MKILVVSRLALVTGAAALLVAGCSSDRVVSPVSSSLAIRGPMASVVPGGTPTKGFVQVCVDPGSTKSLTITTTASPSSYVNDLVNPSQTLAPGNCGSAITRTFDSNTSSPMTKATLAASTSPTPGALGVTEFVCVASTPYPGAGAGDPALICPVATGSTAGLDVWVNANHGATVTFKFTGSPQADPPPTLTTSAVPSIGGSITAGGVKTLNEVVLLTATPAPGYMFTGFTSDPCVTVTTTTCNVTMSTNRNVIANFAPIPTIGTPLFVVGNVEPHAVNDIVNFWGAQWWKNNIMDGFVANGVASFKGYAMIANNTCPGTWSSRVGNSPPPPATIPRFINVIVTSTVTKNGPDLGGNIVQIITVDTQGSGYGPNPGHAGNGKVTAVLCGG